MRVESRGFEADGSDEGVEVIDDALIEAIKLRSPLGFEPSVCFDGAEKACREWGIDAFEELQEDEADRVAFRQESIAPGVWKFLDQALGSELRQIVTQRGEAVVLGGAAQSLGGLWVEF